MRCESMFEVIGSHGERVRKRSEGGSEREVREV